MSVWAPQPHDVPLTRLIGYYWLMIKHAKPLYMRNAEGKEGVFHEQIVIGFWTGNEWQLHGTEEPWPEDRISIVADRVPEYHNW